MKMDQRLSKFPRKPIYTTPRSPLIHKENHSDPILPSLQLTFYHPLTCVATPQVKAEVTQRKSLSECGLTLPAPSALAHIMLSVTGFTCPYFCRHVSLSIISTATCSGLPSFQSRNICSIGHRQLCLLILTCCRTSACALGEPRSVTPQPVANPVIPSKSLLAQLERPLLGLGRQIGLQTIYVVKKMFS